MIKMKIKACKICGKWFVAKGRAECCSDECKHQNYLINERARSKRRYKNNKELRKELNKEWNDNNKKLRKELNKEWNDNNKEKRKQYNININKDKLSKQRKYAKENGYHWDSNEVHDNKKDYDKFDEEKRKNQLNKLNNRFK
jgi:hypothetical protein